MKRGLFLLMFLAGCSASSLVLAHRDALNGSRINKLTALRDFREVRGQVTDISLPFFRFPSILGDKATLTASVPLGAIPGRPELSAIVLKYDCDNLRNTANEGSALTFLFLPDGRFVGVKEWMGWEL